MEAKLAEALLRRKELADKITRIGHIKEKDLFDVRFKRTKISEEIDDITAQVPKVELSEVTKEYDYYASQMRQVDAAIQQANWTTVVELPDGSMDNWDAK